MINNVIILWIFSPLIGVEIFLVLIVSNIIPSIYWNIKIIFPFEDCSPINFIEGIFEAFILLNNYFSLLKSYVLFSTNVLTALDVGKLALVSTDVT